MVEVGMYGEVTLVVGEGDTAIAHGSGDLPVLATPRVLALAEQAAVAAVGDGLAAGQTSVGVFAELHHVRATSRGGAVTAHAEVVAVEGRRIFFDFEVVESGEVSARGNHQRVIVDRDRFLGAL